MKRLFSLLLACFVCTAAFVIYAGADGNVNGISVSSQRLLRGDGFTVTLYVPPCENADTASIKVTFDSSVFEVVGWDVKLPGGVANTGSGFFAVSAANASRAVDMSGGLTMNAVMRVKETAKSGEYTFSLSESSLCYVDESGCEFIELWAPEALSAKVTVTGEEPESREPLPVSSQSDIPEEAEKSGNNIVKIIITAGAALLAAGLCFAAVKLLGRRRK